MRNVGSRKIKSLLLKHGGRGVQSSTLSCWPLGGLSSPGSGHLISGRPQAVCRYQILTISSPADRYVVCRLQFLIPYSPAGRYVVCRRQVLVTCSSADRNAVFRYQVLTNCSLADRYFVCRRQVLVTCSRNMSSSSREIRPVHRSEVKNPGKQGKIEDQIAIKVRRVEGLRARRKVRGVQG